MVSSHRRRHRVSSYCLVCGKIIFVPSLPCTHDNKRGKVKLLFSQVRGRPGYEAMVRYVAITVSVYELHCDHKNAKWGARQAKINSITLSLKWLLSASLLINSANL